MTLTLGIDSEEGRQFTKDLEEATKKVTYAAIAVCRLGE